MTAYCLNWTLNHVESRCNVMAHGDAREGKWRGNWRMQWVASILHATSEHGVSSITTADAHSSAESSRLNWRPTADLNGHLRLAERRNLVSARVPSHFNWAVYQWQDVLFAQWYWWRSGSYGILLLVDWQISTNHLERSASERSVNILVYDAVEHPSGLQRLFRISFNSMVWKVS